MDIETVKKAKEGDAAALEEIYNKTRQMVYFTTLGIVKNENDAQDLVQDTYIKAFQNIGRLKNEEAFISWLKTIVINISKNYMKKKKPLLFKENKGEDAVIGSVEEVDENFIPQNYVDNAEKRRIIKDMIESLPDSQRMAVMLYYFDELPLSEVSKIMETAEGTTKSRLNYARKQIRAKVEDEEKKGNKLYVGVPMLTKILHLVSKDCNLPTETAKRIFSSSLKAANVAASSAPSTTAGTEAASKAVASNEAATSAESVAHAAEGAKGAAKTATVSKGIIAKIAAIPLKTKIIAAISAVVILAGAGTGIAVTIKQHNEAAKAAIVLQQKQKAKDKAASEAAIKKKAEEEAAAKKKADKEVAKKKIQAANEQNMALYKEYYDANFKDKAKAVFFADLTHNGYDEMLITYSTIDSVGFETGNLNVYTVINNTVLQIFNISVDTSHAGYGEEDLYNEKGLYYLYEPFDPRPNTWGEDVASVEKIGYTIFYLDSSGNKNVYKSDKYGKTQYMDDHVEYDQKGNEQEQKRHEKAIQQAMDDYPKKSILLISSLRDENVSFGQGKSNPFNEGGSPSSQISSAVPSSSSQPASSAAGTFDRKYLYLGAGSSWTVSDDNSNMDNLNFYKDNTVVYDNYTDTDHIFAGTYQLNGDTMVIKASKAKYDKK